MISMSAHSKALSKPKPDPTEPRQVADFRPSPWGDQFLNFTLNSKVVEAQEEIVKELKEELKRELMCCNEKPLMEQLRVIDSIKRLGVAYHFEPEIEDTLRRIHETSSDYPCSNDLVLTSLRFLILRQHGFKVSSDVFKEFIGANGSLKEEVANDVQSMLSLYEACHVRGHGEDILEEALPFTISNLNMNFNQMSNPSLEKRIRHALKKPHNKRLTRVECVRYMQVYEQDDPLHNKTLLRFAKLDFNLLQAYHKNELSEIYGWWKGIGVTSTLPLRDRIVESYFWGSAVYFEPQYSIARKIAIMGCQILTSVDDIYDAYATLEELEIFTQAVQRWDKSCLDQLPKDLRWFYQTLLLDAHEEMERDLAPKGRSKCVHYAKEEMKALCQTYLTEAKWRQEKYIPTLDEYMKIAHRNIAYVAAVVYTFLDMDMATESEFEWVCNLSKPVKAVSLLLRILDDIGGNKFDEIRGHPCLIVECYKNEYGVSYEGACKLLYKKVDELWKDLNEAMIQPSEVPMPLLKCVLNLGRAVETIYDAGEDGFTSLNRAMKRNIENLGHPCLIVECYKNEYGVSYEGACKLLYKKVDELWKDLNEAMIQPSEVPMPLLKCVLNLGRAVETIYDAGEDGFTSLNRAMKRNIENLYVHSITI